MATTSGQKREREFVWDSAWRYRSNNGTGKYLARILCVVDGVVTLEWGVDGSTRRHRHRTRLSLTFFTSDRCGWRLVEGECPTPQPARKETPHA